VRCARLAKQAGYDGVEVMGSEGYLLNQFLCARTNRRQDRWGGSIENRMRLPVEVVRRIRAAVGPDFIIMYRHSVLDLVEGGNTWDEVVTVARRWRGRRDHPEYRLRLARGAGAHHRDLGAARGLRRAWRAPAREVKIPVVASNRINMPHEPKQLLARGDADLVSMARPFLADPDWVAKAPAAAATRSTPASPATRPASTTPSPTSAPPAWSIRAPATRRNWCTARAERAAAPHRRGRRRAGRACRRPRSRPSAATR
jgi:2,4-dienoyl-CoA reductase (NADPH2)